MQYSYKDCFFDVPPELVREFSEALSDLQPLKSPDLNPIIIHNLTFRPLSFQGHKDFSLNGLEKQMFRDWEKVAFFVWVIGKSGDLNVVGT